MKQQAGLLRALREQMRKQQQAPMEAMPQAVSGPQAQIMPDWQNLPGNSSGLGAGIIPQGTQAIQPGMAAAQGMASGFAPMNNPQIPNMGMEMMPQVQNGGGVQLPGQTPKNLGGSLGSALAGKPIQAGKVGPRPQQTYSRVSPGVYRDASGKLVRR